MKLGLALCGAKVCKGGSGSYKKPYDIGVVLEALARSLDPDIRFEVAMNRRSTRRAFELLAEDTDASVRHRVACNPKTPSDILRRLSLDFDEQVSVAAKKT